jgi:hypothetical protein
MTNNWKILIDHRGLISRSSELDTDDITDDFLASLFVTFSQNVLVLASRILRFSDLLLDAKKAIRLTSNAATLRISLFRVLDYITKGVRRDGRFTIIVGTLFLDPFTFSPQDELFMHQAAITAPNALPDPYLPVPWLSRLPA